MPQVDLGKVKGEPFRFEDFTPEQKLEIKGDKGDMPIVKAGAVTTVPYEEGAKITSETNGDVTSFHFQVPVGQRPPFYGALEDFPRPGDPTQFCVDNTFRPILTYGWDVKTEDYILIGSASDVDPVMRQNIIDCLQRIQALEEALEHALLGYAIRVVDTLPAEREEKTLYFLKR